MNENEPVNSDLFEPQPEDAGDVDQEAAAAAAEAAEIGGHTNTEGLPEAERPLAESGEGEAEGFELAEEQLIESASHGDASGHPSGDRLPPEDAAAENLASYGEADDEHVSENVEDDH